VKKLRIRDVRALCEIYEVDANDIDRAVELAKQAQVTSWYTAFGGLYSDATFNMYVGLSASATTHRLPRDSARLLQTADYARA